VSNCTLGYLGPYRLLNVVHRGPDAEIWQAYHDGEQQRYGVKTPAERVRRSREHLGYLRREAAVMAEAVHPNIIAGGGFHIDRGRPYLVMEWFPAPNMKARIRQDSGTLAPLVPRIVEESARALAHLHTIGYVHRDIKPDNFLVGDQGEVKLIDFALAQRVRSGIMKWLIRPTKLQGTRSYMAPEQIRRAAPDYPADVYSFGCVVFELIARHPPFTGNSAAELLNKHLKSAPPSLEAAEPNVRPEFAALVRQCMAKDPADRPATMEDFLVRLQQIRVFRECVKGGKAPDQAT